MPKIKPHLGALAVTALSTVLLSGCYVTSSGPSYRHHPAHCQKVETVKRVCVSSHHGHCQRFKTQTYVRWNC
jgi:hypothetical protein